MPDAPHSPDAEATVVGLMLASSRAVGDVIGSQLDPEHFYLPWAKVLYAAIQEAYYNDDPTDALTIAEHVKRPLAKLAGVDERQAVKNVEKLASGRRGNAKDAAAIVRRHADYRALLDLSSAIVRQVEDGVEDPSSLAGSAAHEAMQIATRTALTHELVTFDQIGPRVIERAQIAAAARAKGIELGVYFDLGFFDSFFRGLRPSEYVLLGGEPGAGKSAVAWVAGTKFAEKQLTKPPERRIGTAIFSLEMAEDPASDRLAQSVSKIDGGKLREGRVEKADLQQLVDSWHDKKGLPLIFNFSSNMRASALRALIVEAIRKHNVGLVIVDHFRYVDMDPPSGRRWSSAMEAEEELSRFFKQDIATQLNVAVIVLAHTVKGLPEDGRPTMTHLRGGQMVTAHADYVGFVYRPYVYATEDDIDLGNVKRTDAEMIMDKTRHATPGTVEFHFDPSTMTIY